MTPRWVNAAFAVVAASAFAVSVEAGTWWTLGDLTIGPFGLRQCVDGDCRGFGFDDPLWSRLGMATGAAGLIAMLLLIVIAGAVAAGRVPALIARTALVAIATATIAGAAFILRSPGGSGAAVDRGIWLFGCGVVLGGAAVVGVLRTHRARSRR